MDSKCAQLRHRMAQALFFIQKKLPVGSPHGESYEERNLEFVRLGSSHRTVVITLLRTLTAFFGRQCRVMGFLLLSTHCDESHMKSLIPSGPTAPHQTYCSALMPDHSR